MTRHLVVFIVTFAIGAVIAVIMRTASHKPYEQPSAHPAAVASMATSAVPAHVEPTPAAPVTGSVNSICAICAMPVNPALGTIAYKGQNIGFGCKACPPKFAANPEKYGEAALKNQVVE